MNASAAADLLARPGPDDPLQYHLRQSAAAHVVGDQVRGAYHQRWVRHLQEPTNDESLPTVAVVIPLYNRAQLVAKAIESCLDQDYPKVEVIVVDDGSTDDPTRQLGRLLDRIRLIRQKNRGVSAARNHGLRLAQTDFVHFLDSDDYLLPGSISSKIAAFREIADAELCTSLYACSGANNVSSASDHEQPPLGDQACPTIDFLSTVVQRFPMVNCTVMAPRWVWLATGCFDEELRQAEDIRYWFRMAIRGTKVIALQRPLTVVRFTDHSLTTARHENLGYCFHAAMANLRDLLETPHAWPYVGRYLASFWTEPMQQVFESPVERSRWKQEIHRLISQLPQTGHSRGLSAGLLARVIRRACDRRPEVGELFSAAEMTLAALVRTANRVTPADLALWSNPHLPDCCAECNKPALRWIARERSMFGRMVGWFRAA